MYIPISYEDFNTHWQLQARKEIESYISGKTSFIPNLLPELAVGMSTEELLSILHRRLGNSLFDALNPINTIESPVAPTQTTDWLRKVNMVGINVRTIGNFWNIIKYVLTIPAQQSAVHILPIWEPGVVASLYGMSSWNVNTEFFSEELATFLPAIDTVELQLKVVTNLLHAMGRTVGMDVIPHTDRYAEIVLANPSYFEWLRRRDLKIVDHTADLHLEVERVIMRFVSIFGGAARKDFPAEVTDFFGDAFGEEQRLLVLFGELEDQWGRIRRRNQLVQFLYNEGLEPVPATMAPPYRGLRVSADPEAKTIDPDGRIWRDYEITAPQEMSRVFGPLTRYKLYERLEDNQHWAIDFERPRVQVWDYVCQKYAAVQANYNFDFMRGDMSHVQMRAAGVPEEVNEFYDIHRSIKQHIQKQVPHFGYFAETFLSPPNIMGYGDEVAHLEQSAADTTLGNLQSMVVGSTTFISELARYHKILRTRKVVPNFTIMTSDKDDPRFDKFYLTGSEVRLFCALFLTDMPSYMGLGFEVRDIHPEPVPNEYYTKLYVFRITAGPKATQGEYRWGSNGKLFHNLMRTRFFAESIYEEIEQRPLQWIISPDETGQEKLIVWRVERYIFIVNFDALQASTVNHLELNEQYDIIYSTASEVVDMEVMQAMEGRVYRLKADV